jgi:hypothetical protein
LQDGFIKAGKKRRLVLRIPLQAVQEFFLKIRVGPQALFDFDIQPYPIVDQGKYLLQCGDFLPPIQGIKPGSRV